MPASRQIEADVVVLGAGPGGMAAVAAAADAGVQVAVAEARQHIGGNAVWSTGYLAFVDSQMQRDHGISDDEDAFVADARRAAARAGEHYGIVWDEPIVRLFARESKHTYRMLIERGVRFSRFIPRPGVHSVDRMAATVDTWAFQRAFQPDFALPNVTALYNTTARRLITDGEGAVVGAMVTDNADGTETRLTACRGVVLSTGGYQANPVLRQRYQPEFLARGPYLGVDTARGDGHLMGQAVGGDLVNMTCLTPLVIVSSSLVEDAIAVNSDGRRFHDETGPYEQRVAALLSQTDRRAHYIFDATVDIEKRELVDQMPAAPLRADTLRDLATAIGADADALATTVRQWNALLADDRGADRSFGRVVMPPQRRQITTAPFVAVPMMVGVNFSSGGFTVTPRLQVMDIYGVPIPGLYAAGDCVGALGPIAELGGTHICAALTLGRLAGSAAAVGERDAHVGSAVFGAHLSSKIAGGPALVHLRGE